MEEEILWFQRDRYDIVGVRCEFWKKDDNYSYYISTHPPDYQIFTKDDKAGIGRDKIFSSQEDMRAMVVQRLESRIKFIKENT